MKYIGENAIKKLISLIKGDLATKQPTITVTGVLERDTAGAINGVETVGAILVETQEATLVDIPNGLLKGDGTTISVAVPGTDYAVPSTEPVVTAEKIADAMSLSELAAGDMVRALSVDSEGKPMTWGRKALDFINALDYGVKGDGITNDAPAIQALLDQVGIETTNSNVNGNGTLHLPAATYLISSPLVIGSNVHFKCDGLIKYTGTGSAVIVDGRYSYVDIAMISAENGTGFEMDASRNNYGTMSNDIRIGRIRPCVRGIYIHDDADHQPVTTNYIQCDYINGSETAGTYGIEVYSDRKYLTEMHYTIGRVTAFAVGLYVHSTIWTNELAYAATQRFHQIHIEGVTESGIILENVSSCIFENLRLDESYGDYAITFKGSVNSCSIRLQGVDFSKINISELNYARANRLFAPTSLGEGNSIGYDYILTNNPVTGLPAILPLGRTTTVIYGDSTYQQVVDLYQRGMGVLVVVGKNNTSALPLVKADLSTKTLYFSGLVPTPSNTFYYGRSCICKEVDGVTTWETRENVALQTQKITATISEQSAEDEYPSAKAVWDHCKDFLAKGDLSGKQDKIEAEGILKGTAGGVVAAVAGTDYAAVNHTHTAATENTAGFMSAADKSKLDGIAHGANNTTVDTAMSTTSTNPVQNKVVAAAIDSAIQSAIQNTWEASY